MRQTIIGLLLNESGASAVEDGIALGIFGAMILAGAPVIGTSVGDLCHAIGKFLGLI
jgi:Flp pilus assembly pilin Flp